MGLRCTVCALALLALVAGACEDDDARRVPAPAPDRMAVVRVRPDLEAGALALNQSITVDFSAPVDRLTVNPDTFRVVGARDGIAVRGRYEFGTRSVTFVPVPPVRPDLGDGGFRPGESYQLQIAGAGRFNALLSTGGGRLDRPVQRAFRVMSERSNGDYASPFVPVGTGTEPFTLLGPGTGLRLAADVRRFQLHFSLPVLPTSLGPGAVQVKRLVTASTVPEDLVVASVRIVPAKLPGTRAYGSTVEVELADENRVGATDQLYVILEQGERALRDYRGRPVRVFQDVHEFRLFVDPGSQVKVIESPLRRGPWAAMTGDELTFENAGSFVAPRCRVAAGDGRLGAFRPTRDVVLRPGVPFDRGDGVEVVAPSADFAFESIDVPAGVTVRVESTEPARLRAVDGVTFDGRLELATPFGATFAPGQTLTPTELIRRAGCAVVSGGDLRVRGVVVHDARGRSVDDGLRSPLTLVAAGALETAAAMPLRCVLGVPEGRPVAGALEQAIRVNCLLRRGLPGEARRGAHAHSPWLALPVEFDGALDIRPVGASGGIVVEVQIAPPHSVDTSRPNLQAIGPPLRCPNDAPIRVAPGSFLRVVLRGEVAGTSYPSLRGLDVLRRD